LYAVRSSSSYNSSNCFFISKSSVIFMKIALPYVVLEEIECEVLSIMGSWYELFFTGLQLSNEVTKVSGPKLVDFKRVLKENDTFSQKVNQLRAEVEAFSRTFPIPGYPDYWEVSYPWWKLLTDWKNCQFPNTWSSRSLLLPYANKWICVSNLMKAPTEHVENNSA